MNRSTKTALILGTIFILIASALPSAGKSLKHRGDTYRTDSIEISDIESRTTELDRTGLIYYSIMAKVGNRTNHPLTVTLMLQAVDRRGYEVGEANFFKKHIGSRDTISLSNRLVMDASNYRNIWEWKVDELRVK